MKLPAAPRSPLWQLAPSAVQRDTRWHCERQYRFGFGTAGALAPNGAPTDTPMAEFFFIDTSPFVDKYQTKDWAVLPGGILEQSWQSQVTFPHPTSHFKRTLA